MADSRRPMSYPTFVVIGAMRAGTTTLHYDLMAHPDVVMASVKEPNHFVFGDTMTDLPLGDEALERLRANSVVDEDAYRDLFPGAQHARAVGDVSPSYLYSPSAARRLREMVPDVRIIAILRNPVDRAYSAYMRRADVDPDVEAFVETAEVEAQKLKSGSRLPFYPLILGSLYSRHLVSYFEHFPPSQRLVLLFERFWPDYPGTLGSVQDFIGVGRHLPSTTKSLNRSGVPRWSALDRALRSSGRVKAFSKRNLPSGVLRMMVAAKQSVEDRSSRRPTELPPALRWYLLDQYFREDIERVEEMMDCDLTIWRT